ncbi:helix-turn-helix domain-containing protein [Gluconacetobacter azotocaptans]|uniref:Helix-turn-helix domain-containing protein n=1 Tax=Gluconacetobacter azotocaptans TaxID=142834 RepID=A0A7W4JSS5_9PROT|nr:helix-turn-helix domain-containing protein [Gluconacetobacter azotocaptans]MBB2190208.1 helix-turn-helix domain-containing protein [Gluconacetobacter azotocaptans]MBM9402413.1 helix-turn-helix domain-containing protein [Gluconacetobacter azotocaptans]GBQ29850.1 transcriptional regulator MerR [Gluconacetobacter azotocaptans DSM 13594]
MRQTFSIGELGRRAGTKVETIRYYERSGLLPPPPRSSGNYRVYDQEHLRRLSFIRRARKLGFSLEQVRALLDMARHGDRPCDRIDAVVQEHVAEIERKIRDLQCLRHELSTLLGQCGRRKVEECRIVEALGPAPSG